MPKIEVSRRDLLKLSGCQISSDSELEKMLSVLKGELDSSDGDELKIELNDTNRPDLWCVEGIARGLRCNVNGREEHLSNLPAAQTRILVDKSLGEIRPFIAAFCSRNWTLDETNLEALITTQEKLSASFGRNRKTAAIGFYRLNEIRFPVYYKAVSGSTSFIPLGENREMSLTEILEKHETGKEYAHLLSDVSLYPLLEDSSGSILSFPPVINSQTTGRIFAGDSSLFCEVTGTDWHTVQLTASILACNLEDRGASIEPVRIVYPDDTPSGNEVESPIIYSDEMKTTRKEVESILGVNLTDKQINDALCRMDYARVRVDGNTVYGVLPPYRHDGINGVDMVEDVAIAVGMNSFDPILPEDFTVGQSAPIEDLSDAIRVVLVGSGCEEIMRPVLISRKKLVELSRTPFEPVGITNPMTAEYGVVRNSLLSGLLEVESSSGHAAYPHRIFEVGEVLVDNEGLCETLINVAVLFCDNEAGFGEVHSILGILCSGRGLKLELKHSEDSRFIPGRCAEIIINDISCGILGEIHPGVLTAWGISRPASAFEIDIEALKG